MSPVVLIKKESKRFLLAASSGLISAGVQLIIFNSLRNFIPSELAVVIAIEIAIINNFILNNNIAFATARVTKQRFYLLKFFKFNSVALGSLTIQLVIFYLGTHFWGKGIMIENFLMITGIFLGFIANYLGYYFFVWI